MAFDPLTAALEVGNKLVDHFFPDATKAAEAKQKLLELQQSGELARLTAETSLAQGQLEINKAEASSVNWFVAGARPFILWACGIALVYVSIVDPIGRFIAMVMYHYAGPFPVIDTTITMQVLLGLLGLSGMRTYEKRTGTEGNR